MLLLISGLVIASLMLPAFMVWIGWLARVQGVPVRSCPAVDPLDHTVLLPNPADCSSFFSCSNGVPILMHCPDGLHFNDKLDVCDWPQNAGCEDGKYGCVDSALCSL